jgi:phage baseplate assembly protein W
MPGYSAILPLTMDPDDGVALNKTYAAVAKQNFKMLLLTVPGEKIMDPEFGVGLPRFFFENITPETLSKIDSRIRKQTLRYLPFLNVL